MKGCSQVEATKDLLGKIAEDMYHSKLNILQLLMGFAEETNTAKL